MQAMLGAALALSHIADTLDFSLIEVAPGKAVFQGTPSSSTQKARTVCTAVGMQRC